MTPPRVLMVGAVNSPHVQHLAAALDDAVIAGWVAPELPPPVGTVAVIPTLAGARFGAPVHAAWLWRLIRRVRPDVVHVHGVTEFATAAARVRARPLLITAYGSDLLVPGPQRSAALRAADAVTGDSPRLVARATELGARETHLLGWGVDLDRFAPADRAAARARLGLPLPADARIVLSPRALAPLYNPGLVVEAFDRVADGDPGVHLVVKHLGDGSVPASRHPDRVHVIGHVPYEDLPAIYAAADVCVSVPSSDSAPRTVWEAMACGTPCVVSDLPWLDGMVRRGVEAVAVPLDAGAVAAAITGLLADGAAVGERARALVQRDQDAREHQRRWLALYERLSARSTAAR